MSEHSPTPGSDGGQQSDSTGQIDGLPVLFVYKPYFPGESFEFEVKWDHEAAAVKAADGGPGILALVPARTDHDKLVLEAKNGKLVATLGSIVARSGARILRIRAEMRFRVTELQAPPKLIAHLTVPYEVKGLEQGAPVTLCQLKSPIARAWPRLRNFS